MNICNLLSRRVGQIWAVTRFIFAKVISKYTDYKDVWLLSERGKEARDNGYALYRWIKHNHPEIPLKYVISKDSKDYHRIDRNDIIDYDSIKHFLCLCSAKYLISTHIMGYTPDHGLFYKMDRKLHIFKNQKKIFLQHGIIKDYLPSLFYGNVDLNLFICGSFPEYEYILENFGFPSGVVKYTGLCRFDSLNRYVSQKQILIMPTFRMYIDKNNFELSEYFHVYKELLSSDKFASLLERYDYSAIFYPHYEFQSKISLFKTLTLSNRILVADMTYDVQQLLKDSNILITDFSSVFFDMMYMNKPMVFYQFDEAMYRKEHYKKGYLDYNDVGPVVYNLPDLLKNIENILSNDCDISVYKNYYTMTFPLRDESNCKRVYEAILHS